MLAFIKLTKWFVIESIKYLSPIKLKEILYFPIAYYKFMKLNSEG